VIGGVCGWDERYKEYLQNLDGGGVEFIWILCKETVRMGGH